MSEDDIAVWIEGREISYGELFIHANRIVARLRKWPNWPESGVPRIGLLAPNGLNYMAVALAVLKAGGCLVPVATEMVGPERAELARITALHAVLLLDGYEWPGERVEIDAETGLQGCAMEPGPPCFPVESFEALGPAMIRLSSGTTRRSKGVVLSHASLRERIELANGALRIGPADRVLWTLSMAHHFAVSIILYLRFGATIVIENSPMAEDVLATAEAGGATVAYGAPFHYALLAADRGEFCWSSLRLAVSTAAALPLETARAFHERFGKSLVQALGVIECGLPLLNLDKRGEKPESVGLPVEGWEISLRDESGLEVGTGKTGELWLRGGGTFDAYLDPWQPGSEVLEDGWFRTGDLCCRDAEGAVQILGRCVSVINVGGMKVFPEEVEAVLDRDAAVERSRVTARADAIFGSVPSADVLPVPGAVPDLRALRAACRDALAPYKVPVAVQVVDSLPMTANGKLRR